MWIYIPKDDRLWNVITNTVLTITLLDNAKLTDDNKKLALTLGSNLEFKTEIFFKQPAFHNEIILKEIQLMI